MRDCYEPAMQATLSQFWRSSASWRVRWALAVKGVSFTSVVVDLARGAQLETSHIEKSPMGRVPVVVVDGRALVESVAILEYLDEVIPTPPLYPRDPWLRARVRQVVEVINAGIQPLQNLAVLLRHSEDRDEQRAFAKHFNELGLAALERVLVTVAAEHPTRGAFAVGDALTAADLFLVPQVEAARRYGADPAPFPRVLAAEAAALATEHAERALPKNQPGAPPDADVKKSWGRA
jgi:maleylacetoacetate isomerase